MTQPLRFERVSIQRMPGFEDGGFTLDGLSPGINIVHGPNASGKSSSARALEALLWPRSAADQRLLLVGRFRLGDAVWTVDLHGTAARYQRDGSDAGPPQLSPEGERDRYRLSLHELLRADNPYFAEKIRTETAGGYDVPRAGETLAPRSAASPLRKEQEALSSAKVAHQEAVSRQEGLRGRERRLADLSAERDRARAAAERLGVLAHAIEHASAVERLAAAREELSAYPAGMAKFLGDERDRLAKLTTQRAAIAESVVEAEGRMRRARQVIAEARLPDGGVARALISGIRADLDALRDVEHAIAAAEAKHDEADRKLQEERARISGAIDEDRLAALDHKGMAGLAQFSRRAAELRREDLELEAAAKRLSNAGSPEDLRALSEAIALLERWLREPADSGGRDRRSRTLAMAGGAALVVGGIALAWATPLALALAAIGAVLLIAVVFGGVGSDADPRSVRRRDYAQLKMDEPAEWSPEGVRAALDRLLERRAEATLAERLADERRSLERRRDALAPKLQALEAERSRLADRLGLDPDVEHGHLCWVAETVGRWQAAHADRSGALKVIDSAGSRASAVRDSIRDRLAPYGYDGLETTGAMAGALDDLAARADQAERAATSAGAAQHDLERLAKERESCESDRRAVFEKVGLAADDERTLQAWHERLPGYRAAVESVRAAEISATNAARRLSSDGVPDDDPIRRASEAELEAERTEARAQADRFEPLVREIGQIEESISKAKADHAIEEALQRVARCEADLEEARERDVRAAVAHVLIQHLKQATLEQHLPEVFHRARRILSRITHGRYDLRFGGDGEPEFWAFDNVEGRGRRLDQLSSGTRVQLLLAVRIAFIETQERDARLPLVLDEVLGNSDDERAWAIMQAVVELAREGRQVFYLTAQADEVGKWRAALENGADVEYRVIDLAGTRKIQRVVEVPESFSVATVAGPGPIEPGGMTHEEYGRAIGVPAIDRSNGQAGGLHLWYLVEEPDRLYRLLRLADRWGALQGIVRNGGSALVDRAEYDRAAALAIAADTFLEGQRVGLGRPVDRLTLEATGAVSETFIDRIDAVARMVGGDAASLIESMERREVPEMRGFRTQNIGAVRDYLEENGYLPTRAPLSEEELVSRTLSGAASEIAAGVISIDEVHRLIARLRLGCG